MGAQGSKGETSASMASLKGCLKIGNQGQEHAASDNAGDEIESEVYFEEHSSPLMSLDDFVLIKLISFLDGPTLLSVMLTCKRLHRLGSDPRHWGSPAYFSMTLYYLRKAMLLSLDPKECVAVEDLVLKAKKVKRRIEVLTTENIALVWEAFGPVVAKLFCMLNSVHWFENYSYTDSSEMKHVKNRSATLKLSNGQLISLKYEIVYTGQSEEGIDIYAYSADSKTLFSTQPWRIRQIHGQWVEVSNNTLALGPIAYALNKEVNITEPFLTGEFIKAFVETILPVWCDTEFHPKDIIEMKKTTESASLLRSFRFLNSAENVPNQEAIQLLVKEKHERFWWEYEKRIEYGLNLAQNDVIDFKNIWKTLFQSLANSVREVITRSNEHKILLIDMIKDCTMSANKLVIHHVDYMIRPLIHKLVARVKPFTVDNPEASRTVEFCLLKNEILKVQGNQKAQRMTFTCPKGKIFELDLHGPKLNMHGISSVTKLIQKCINSDFKGSYQAEVWDFLVVYFFYRIMEMNWDKEPRFDPFEIQFEDELDGKKKRGRKLTTEQYYHGFRFESTEETFNSDD